jgi:CubicO group peptidase (beta-lactamase class C family)
MAQDVHPVADPAAAGLSAAALGRLTGVLAAEVERNRLPGAVAAVVRRGKLGYFEVLGRQNPASDAPMRADSIFRVFSMTKPIVSLAVMMLVEEGRLLLADPISKYLPEFAEMKVGVERNGTFALEPAAAPITVHDLLRHTSGLTYDFVATGRLKDIYTNATLHRRSQTNAEFCKALAGLPLLHQPGTHWSYSHATDVLGRLVEVVAGAPLEEVLQARILGPLGMTETSFALRDEDAPRLAALYSPDPETGRAARNEVLGQRAFAPPEFLSGGGGLLSTAHDYLRFMRMLLGGGQLDGVRLLGPRTVAYMGRNHLPGGADLTRFGRPLFAESAFDGIGFGLGFSVVLDPAEGKVPSSAGELAWGGAASTAFYLDPLEDLGVLFLTQLLPSSAHPIRPQLRQLVAQALVD